MPFPITAPVFTPTWRSIITPAVKIRWRPAVVAHWNTQHIEGYVISIRQLPRSVVPTAGIPVVSLENPVKAVGKEVISIHLGTVVDRITRDLDEIRIRRHGDSDIGTRRCETGTHSGIGF
jgi:hypothetical protein